MSSTVHTKSRQLSVFCVLSYGLSSLTTCEHMLLYELFTDVYFAEVTFIAFWNKKREEKYATIQVRTSIYPTFLLCYSTLSILKHGHEYPCTFIL